MGARIEVEFIRLTNTTCGSGPGIRHRGRCLVENPARHF